MKIQTVTPFWSHLAMLRTKTLALLALIFFNSALGAQATAVAGDPASQVDKIFARFNSTESPGCAVGVAQKGQPILSRAYGMGNLEYGVANTPATVFEAGSVSKQFTATAAVLLAQQGKLSLDDPVRKYVPELPDYGTPVTIRHMLNHTSGLRDWGTVVAAAGWPRGTRVHTHEHVLDIVSRQKSLNFPPGSEYLYSNTGYNLLAIIVSRVSGQSFAEFTKKNIFEPLGMTSTQWRDDYTRIVKGRATAYSQEAVGLHMNMPFENVHGNGGLLTTVGDLLLWNENFVHYRVGGRALADELQRRGRLTVGRDIAYALGLFVSTYKGIPEVSHGGATAGYRSFLARYPAQKLSVALLCNFGNVTADDLAHKVADLFLPSETAQVASAPGGEPTIRLPAAGLATLSGTYRNMRTNEALRLATTDSSLRSGSGGELLSLSTTRFRSPSGQNQATFVLDSAGRPSALRIATSDGDTILYVRTLARVPSAKELAEYSGEYHSDEAEVTYTVAVKDSTLVMRRRPDLTLRLTPVYADAFSAPNSGTVLFKRDTRGQITGMSFGLGRVRDLHLKRTSK